MSGTVLRDAGGHTVVAELLHALGYSLQSNVKTREGRQHPDRDGQFRYIAQAVRRVAATRTTDNFRRHEEERAGRRLQEWWPDLAAGEDAAPRARARLRDPRDRHPRRQGDSVRRL